MELQWVRLIMVLLIIIVSILPVKYFSIMKEVAFQLAMAVLVVGLVLVDPFTGLLGGISLAIIYARVHIDILGPLVGLRPGSVEKIIPYVTEANLKDAQNNVVDESNIDIGLKGIKGVYGEPVYSAQGVENNKDVLPGWIMEEGAPL